MSKDRGIEEGSGGAPEFASLALADLVDGALAEDVSDDRAWELEDEIGRRGVEEALPLAETLLTAQAPSERELGAGILRALASSRVKEERAVAASLLVRLVEAESDPDVLVTAAIGLGKAAGERALEPLVRLSEHPNEEVRFAVASALPNVLRSTLDDRGMKALIQLTADPDEDVRDWATFGLGFQLQGLDTPYVRRALQERSHDANLEVRCEAL